MSGSSENYTVDNVTNRYTQIGTPNLSYDEAGNITGDTERHKVR